MRLFEIIFRVKDNIIKVESVKEQKRRERGLLPVKPKHGVGFSINGKEVELMYRYSVSSNDQFITENYNYFYWDKFFQTWYPACGHSQTQDTATFHKLAKT